VIHDGTEIINTLLGVAAKYRKGYCYPSQKKILNLLDRFHRVVFSLRTLNRRLAWLEAEGYIKRQRRSYRMPDGSIRFQTTLYKLTRKTYLYIGSLVRKLRGLGKKAPYEKAANPGRLATNNEESPDEGRTLTKLEVLKLAQDFNKKFQ